MSSLSYNNRHTDLHTDEVSQVADRRPKDLQTQKMNCRNSYTDKKIMFMGNMSLFIIYILAKRLTYKVNYENSYSHKYRYNV